MPSLCLIVAVSVGSVVQAAPEFIDIGGPAGFTYSEATGVSDNGVVVVGNRSIPGLNSTAAFRWTGDTGALPLEPAISGQTWRAAYGVNPAGSAVVGISDPVYAALRWRAGASRTMPGVLGMTASAASDLSDSGGIVIGEGQFSGGGGVPPSLVVRWFPDAIFGPSSQVLGTPAGTNTATALSCSANGDVIVGTATNSAANDLLPYVWRDGAGFEILPTPVGFSRGIPRAVSRNGMFAVGSASSAGTGSTIDCRWSLAPSSVTTIPALWGTNVGARGVSRDGTLVIGPDWVWTASGGVVSLVNYLSVQGINLAGWTDLEFMAVSSDATAICGRGKRAGQDRAFVARNLISVCAPFIQRQPQPTFARVGTSATLSIDAGSPAGASYYWRRLNAAGIITNGVQPGGSIVSGADSPVLTINNVSPQDSDEYSCTVVISCGFTSSAFASLVVGEACGSVSRFITVGATCNSAGQTCDQITKVMVDTAGQLVVEYIASASHCSSVGMNFYLDGMLMATRPPVGPGGSAGAINLGPVSPGAHEIGLQGVGQVGGCNFGTLGAWGGTLKVDFTSVVPTITAQPSPADVCLYTPQSFTARATAGGPPLRTWFIGEAVGGAWRTIVNGTNFAASTGRAAFAALGANTETVTIVPYAGFFDDWPDGLNYLQFGARNACGVVYSNSALIKVRVCCTADFNLDGFLDFSDFDGFVAAFESGEPGADFDNDGFLTFEDFDAYVTAFEAGC